MICQAHNEAWDDCHHFPAACEGHGVRLFFSMRNQRFIMAGGAENFGVAAAKPERFLNQPQFGQSFVVTLPDCAADGVFNAASQRSRAKKSAGRRLLGPPRSNPTIHFLRKCLARLALSV
jgi:hypothetical protein